jgi:MYXO-CTERM domain-containing protein
VRRILAALVAVLLLGLLTGANASAQFPAGGPFDFNISVSPGTAKMEEGMTSFTPGNSLNLTLKSGTPEFVTLSSSSQPPGPTVSFVPGFVNGCTPTCTLGIHLGFLPGAQVGTYDITITGTAGSVQHSTQLTLTVNPMPTPPPVGGLAEVSGGEAAAADASSSGGGDSILWLGAPVGLAVLGAIFLLRRRVAERG